MKSNKIVHASNSKKQGLHVSPLMQIFLLQMKCYYKLEICVARTKYIAQNQKEVSTKEGSVSVSYTHLRAHETLR